METKFASLVFIFMALLLLFSSATFSAAARPHPAFHAATLPETLNHHVVENSAENKEEGCAGIRGEELEECLTRRTLVAHTDYIYTQNLNP